MFNIINVSFEYVDYEDTIIYIFIYILHTLYNIALLILTPPHIPLFTTRFYFLDAKMSSITTYRYIFSINLYRFELFKSPASMDIRGGYDYIILMRLLIFHTGGAQQVVLIIKLFDGYTFVHL